MSYDYFDGLSPRARDRYEQKIAIAGLTSCPYRLPANVWRNDPAEWPEVGYIDIYHYLVESPGTLKQPTEHIVDIHVAML